MKSLRKLLYIIPLTGMMVTSCMDVENIEIDHIGGYATMNNAESEAYYANLRAYKATAWNYNRPVAFGWYSNWAPAGAYRRGYLSAMPDSMDFVSMWSGAPGRYEITPEQKADKEFVQKVKGTKLLQVSLLSYLGKGATPNSVYLEVEKQAKKSLSVRFPSHRQNECAPILSDRVSFFIGRIVGFRLSHYPWRIYFKRITSRYINRRAISVDFPIGRNRKVLPVFIIKVSLIEIYDSFARNRSPSELPYSIQRHRTVSFPYGERSKSSPCRFTINLENMMILPVMHCLCLHRASDQCAKH